MADEQSLQDLLNDSCDMAVRYRHGSVFPEHVCLAAIINDSDGIIGDILNLAEYDVESIENVMKNYLASSGQPETNRRPGYSDATSRGYTSAQKLFPDGLTREKLFISMMADGLFRGIKIKAAQKKMLIKHISGISERKIGEKVVRLGEWSKAKPYVIDMVEEAKNKSERRMPVIGRNKEIERLITILLRATKNSPILVGPPGVGKTAIVGALAEYMAQGYGPEKLRNRALFSIDMFGMPQEVSASMWKDIYKYGRDIILFIDECHTVFGNPNIANFLKPKIATGSVVIIGATTEQEYKIHIENDGAMTRRIQMIRIEEPSKKDSVSILRGLRGFFETHYGVNIYDSAIASSVELASRFMSSRNRPDSCIDIIDEACSLVAKNMETIPEEISALMNKIKVLEIEKSSLNGELSKEEKSTLAKISIDITSAKTVLGKKILARESEKARVDEIIVLQHAVMASIGNGSYQSAEEEKTAIDRMLKIRESLKSKKAALERKRKKNRYVFEQVDQETVAIIASQITGVPIGKTNLNEKEKYLNLGKNISEKIVGQEEAVEAIVNAVMRSRASLSSSKRPIGSFLFMGPTGVGKTEISKVLAKVLFDDEHNMVRFDMSEYQEEHTIARMIGSPPGYVGYEEGGQLVESVKRNPYCIILLDEIEKANNSVLDILLQVLEDGRLTDGKGNIVNMENTVIIMTSNIAAREIQKGIDAKTGKISPEARRTAMKRLQEKFRPEFLNRIDEVTLFRPLNMEDAHKISELLLKDLCERLVLAGEENARKITLKYDNGVIVNVAENGFDARLGARPMRRYIQSNIETAIGLHLLNSNSKTVRFKASIVDEKLVVVT